MKLCTKCGERERSEHHSWCLPCRREGKRDRYERGKNPEPPSWENAKYGNGPEIVRWLEDNGFLTWLTKRDEDVSKRVGLWRDGVCPPFFVVDDLLTGLRVHISELPSRCWLLLRPHRNAQRRLERKRAERAAREAEIEKVIALYVTDESLTLKPLCRQARVSYEAATARLKARGQFRPYRHKGQLR